MAATSVTEFILIPIRQDVDIEEVGTPENRALTDLVSSLKASEGSTRVFSGRQIENPGTYVVVVIWSSVTHSSVTQQTTRNALWSYLAASASAAEAPGRPVYPTDNRRALAIHRVLLTPDDGVAAALSAPTTEVFTGFGVEPGFDSSVREFAARVTAEGPVGYHGCAAGPSVEDIGKPDEEKGPAVMLVIGWDSKEAHTEAKGKPGAIQDNIHMLRVLRKEVDMWHVNLREQC